MTQIKTKILALVAILALALGLALPSAASAAPVRPAVASTTYTDCGQSAFLGSRVCIDYTTAYGPVALIFTSGTSLFGSFAICSSNPVPSGVATQYEWYYTSGSSSQANGWPGSATGTLFLDNGYGAAGYSVVGTCGDNTAAGYLSWFSNSAGYELVVAN